MTYCTVSSNDIYFVTWRWTETEAETCH